MIYENCCITTNFPKQLIFVHCNFSWFITTDFSKFGPAIDQNMHEKAHTNSRNLHLLAYLHLQNLVALTKISSFTVLQSKLL